MSLPVAFSKNNKKTGHFAAIDALLLFMP